MARTKTIKKFIAKWAVVFLGVSLTISSAVISNYFIAKNNERIGDWEREANNIAQQIEEIWENSRALERRKDTAVILLVTAPEHPHTNQFILETLSMYGADQQPKIDFDVLESSFDDYSELVIEQINEKFLVKQQFLDQAQSTQMDNDVLINIALCFQILGLIFVLSKGIL
jgi:hypothetical protein